MLANDPTAPLVLADGTKIDPTTGKTIRDKPTRFVEIPSNTEAREIVARTRKSVADLPMPPKQMSAVGLVAFYTLWGLPDGDIAVAVGATVEQVKNIKALDVYREFMQEARESILATEQEDVRGIFKQHAKLAAQQIITMATSDNDVLAFKASQDVLDRAGLRPNDVVEHRHKMEGALQIVVIEQESAPDMPAVEGDYEIVHR